MDNEYNILAVSSDINFCNSLISLAEKNGADNIFHAVTINDAKRILMTNTVSAIMVNCPLADGFGLDFAVRCAAGKNFPTLILVKKELYETVQKKVADLPVFVLSKPNTPEVISETLSLLKADAIKNNKKDLTVPASDNEKKKKLINRAKLILISFHGMTEEQSHKYIEKRAMEERKTKEFIAQNIITSYGH